MSLGATLGIVFGVIFGLVFLVFLTWAIFKCHYKWARQQNAPMIEEAEKKLKKALNKVEEESSSFVKES